VSEQQSISWTETGQLNSVGWRSENGAAPPKGVFLADDQLPADTAFRLTSEGTGLLWRGDFQNAKQLLHALARRVDRKKPKPATSANEAFHAHRQQQAQRANVLGKLLIQFGDNYRIDLRRAPDVTQACIEAYGPWHEPFVASLRELLGIIGAHEWRKNGIDIPSAGGRIHPHYGVFAPLRSEYIELVATAPLTEISEAFDIGTGTGVLAAVLAKRGVAKIIATDQDPRALVCAKENVERLGFADRIEVAQHDLFPRGKAQLIVCNPPWVPARPSSPLEHAVYDPDSKMLRGFLAQLTAHLAPGGEAWLILSDLAEHLSLRSRENLLAMFAAAGVTVEEKIDARPKHMKIFDQSDPLHAARKAELTSLWRLVAR
jgi:SAM-dependent methyltransferase